MPIKHKCATPEFPGDVPCDKNKTCLWCVQSLRGAHRRCSGNFGGLFLLLQRRCPLSSNCHRFFSLSTIRSFSLRGFHYFESIICRDLWKPRRCSEVLMFGCISLLPRVVKISEYFLKYFSPPSTGKSRNSECAPVSCSLYLTNLELM